MTPRKRRNGGDNKTIKQYKPSVAKNLQKNPTSVQSDCIAHVLKLEKKEPIEAHIKDERTHELVKKETNYENGRSDSVTVKEYDVDQMPWKSFACTPSKLRLDIVLKCGQSFRWSTFQNRPNEFIGVLGTKLWLLKQEPDRILYKTVQKGVKLDSVVAGNATTKTGCEDEVFIRDYFQLGVELEPMYSDWALVDPVFNEISKRFVGVRMLRQDPTENLFSFICSSNNNIQRISAMVEKLSSHYGKEVATISSSDGSSSKTYYSFPTIESLSGDYPERKLSVEETLRSLGFGYRAGYIAKSAKQLQEAGGKEYLLSLRSLSYEKAKEELLKLSGIGPKVADCILLMSLDQPSAIPVDTHMFQIAAQKYLPHLRQRKSVTDKVYEEIGDHFRGLYGPYAGWAHSVLFSADLRHLQNIKSESKGNQNK